MVEMLSDACADFLSQFDRAAATLAETVRWYASSKSAATYGEDLDALLSACKRVHEAPYDDEARNELVRLAASVVRSYDAPTAGRS